jgi:homeobox protein cut-like
MQGYNSTDRRGSLLNDWDLQEIGSSEASEVISSLVLLITPYLAVVLQ